MAKWKYQILKDCKLVSRGSNLTLRELELVLKLADDLFKANNPNSIFTEIHAEKGR